MSFKKTYGTNGTSVSTTFNVGGRMVRVEFSGGVPSGPTRVNAHFSTSDKAMQDAIEADPRFGETIFTERVIEIKEPERIVKKGKTKEYKYITRFQDAANLLATEYKVPIDSITNSRDLAKAAEKAGVSFPNMR